MFTCDKLPQSCCDPPPAALFPLGTEQQMDTPSFHRRTAVSIRWHHLRKKYHSNEKFHMPPDGRVSSSDVYRVYLYKHHNETVTFPN